MQASLHSCGHGRLVGTLSAGEAGQCWMTPVGFAMERSYLGSRQPPLPLLCVFEVTATDRSQRKPTEARALPTRCECGSFYPKPPGVQEDAASPLCTRMPLVPTGCAGLVSL